MRILIPGIGSRGDVQPYIFLGQALRQAGHQVLLASHPDFAPLIHEAGLDFHPLAGESAALHRSDTGCKMLNAGANTFLFLREFLRLRKPYMAAWMAELHKASGRADLVLLTPTSFFLGLSVAEKRGLPVCSTALQPTCPSRYRVNAFLPEAPPWFPFRGAYNLAASYALGLYLWAQNRSPLNRARREVLNLPPFPLLGPSVRRLADIPTLHAYSPLVVPRPADWSDQHHLTGFWLEERTTRWRPSPELRAFLESGPPPVCVGFGSMAHRDQTTMTELALQALEQTNLRGIFLAGWGGLGDGVRSERVFVANSVPHAWLFPRVAAVVHHGGAGTTAAGLRAGVPSVLVPFTGDQYFWGRRVQELGIGPTPIPRNRLTAAGLAAALRDSVEDTTMRRRAAQLGEAIRAERGVDQAVALLPKLAKAAEAFWITEDSLASDEPWDAVEARTDPGTPRMALTRGATPQWDRAARLSTPGTSRRRPRPPH